MPSKSKAEAKTMRAAMHNPAFASKMGIAQRTAAEFFRADQAKGKAAMARLPEHVSKKKGR